MVKTPFFLIFFISIILLFFAARIVLSYRDRQWDHTGNFIILDSGTLTLTVFKPKQEEIDTFLLPKEAYIAVAGGYGFYKLKDVISLSATEGKDESILLSSVSAVFGIPIDATYRSLKEWDRLLPWPARET